MESSLCQCLYMALLANCCITPNFFSLSRLITGEDEKKKNNSCFLLAKKVDLAFFSKIHEYSRQFPHHPPIPSTPRKHGWAPRVRTMGFHMSALDTPYQGHKITDACPKAITAMTCPYPAVSLKCFHKRVVGFCVKI